MSDVCRTLIENNTYLWFSNAFDLHITFAANNINLTNIPLPSFPYRALLRYVKLLSLVRRCQRKNVAVWDLFHHYVAKHPQKPCIIYDGKEWSFREMNDLSNRIANTFQQNGYKKGDVVGLFMDNRPEFVAFWLGLSKIGVIVPLINTNQRQASLIHSVEVAKCQALIYGESLASGK